MKVGQWLKTHKQEAILGAGGIVVTVALYERSHSSSSTSASSSAPSAAGAVPTGVAYPTSVGSTTGTDAASGMESQILGLQSALLALQTQPSSANPGGTAVSPPAAPSASSSPSTSPGFGNTQVGGQSYIDLGTLGPDSFYGYNVGSSGAPIWYLTPGGQLTTNDNSQMLASLPPGTQVLTDTQAPVSASPTTMPRLP